MDFDTTQKDIAIGIIVPSLVRGNTSALDGDIGVVVAECQHGFLIGERAVGRARIETIQIASCGHRLEGCIEVGRIEPDTGFAIIAHGANIACWG